MIFGSLFYFLWEIYWYQKVGLSFIKWHTHIALYVFIWLSILLLFVVINKIKTVGCLNNFFVLFTSIWMTFLLVEVILLTTGLNKTNSERQLGVYKSPYENELNNHVRTWSPEKGEHWLEKEEYRYWRPTNSLGYADKEWPKGKVVAKRLILTLGDSFTEGDGAPYDSSYPSILNDLLQKDFDSILVYNAGICGSDPFFDFMALKQQLITLQPNIVIQAIGTNDLTQNIILRGGFERFNEEDQVIYNKAPVWEPIYAVSYVSRIFFSWAGYNELLLSNSMNTSQINYLDNKLRELTNKYIEYCNKNKIKLVFVLRPDKEELLSEHYFYDFSLLKRMSENHPNILLIDLLPMYKEYMVEENKEVQFFFWRKDGHHNSKGYEMMAKCIHKSIYPELN